MPPLSFCIQYPTAKAANAFDEGYANKKIPHFGAVFQKLNGNLPFSILVE
jgi:hypothetical protein